MSRSSARTIDVHQHLWPPALIEALRGRRRPPRLHGWTLHLDGEPPFDVDPAHHDPTRRWRDEPPGRGSVLLSLSTPLGIEELPARQAMPLLAAWHEDPLPQRYRRWATVCWDGLDLPALLARLDAGFVGLQISATRLATPQAVEAAAPVLRVCEAAGRPVFIHPGPVAPGADGQSTPLWWPAVVDYTAQLQAAWWAWHVAGRALLPHLRICFAAGAGLAPLQHERLASRGGSLGPIDPNVFVDTSSYGRQGIDALTRVLGIDTLVLGSDRPYGRAFDNPTQVGTTTSTSAGLGDAARVAITTINPVRLLQGGPP